MNSAEHYTTRYLETDDLDQYNALLRYTFQVTEEELTATGWKDDEIKQSKFPVLERADVLGCFDGDTLVSQFAVYPLKMNIYGEPCRLCHQCLHLPGVHRAGHYEKVDDPGPDPDV